MEPYLGKRRRRQDIEEFDDVKVLRGEDGELSRAQDLLKHHFEATFDPLPTNATTESIDEDSDDGLEDEEDGEVDWNGICDDNMEVQEFKSANGPVTTTSLPLEQHKAFMSSKPPLIGSSTQRQSGINRKDVDGHDEADDANIKNDIALQRLLQESHLLTRESTLEHNSNTRQRALDLRFQRLGSKNSIFAQSKMPLAQRKGLSTKAALREQTRRHDAKENGIVLEKSSKSGKKGTGRQRAIGAPTVGKYRKGVLTLSKKDVAHIQKSRHTH